jgi:hypothetical protein
VNDLSDNLKRRVAITVVMLSGVLFVSLAPAAEPLPPAPSIAPLISPVSGYDPAHYPTTNPSSSWTAPANSPSSATATTSPAVPAIVHHLDSEVAPASCNDGGCQNCQNGGTSSNLCNGGNCQPFANYNDQPCGSDWAWGCGPWPWRNGPGCCDDWLVGPRWDVKVDGLALFRPGANLPAITSNADKDLNGHILADPVPEVSNNFDWGGGARIDVTGELPRCAGYWVEGVYEGINEWNAAVIFPKFTPATPDNQAPSLPANTVQVQTTTEQRSVHYRSNLQSLELNFEPPRTSCQPFWGVRYIRIEDNIDDLINQESPFPLPGNPAQSTRFTDVLNQFDFANNLVGFQIGMHETHCRLTDRLSIEALANTGIYYNQIRRENLMRRRTTQIIADDSSTPGNEFQDNTVVTTNRDISEQSEVAYVAEASLSAVCQLNRCVALRGGYQILWIDNLHLAENAYLGLPDNNDNLLFHGWHVGVECHR